MELPYAFLIGRGECLGGGARRRRCRGRRLQWGPAWSGIRPTALTECWTAGRRAPGTAPTAAPGRPAEALAAGDLREGSGCRAGRHVHGGPLLCGERVSVGRGLSPQGEEREIEAGWHSLCTPTPRVLQGWAPGGAPLGPHGHFLGVARRRWGATRWSGRTASGQEKGNGPPGVGVRGGDLHCGVAELARDGHPATCPEASSRCGILVREDARLPGGRKSPPGPVLMLEGKQDAISQTKLSEAFCEPPGFSHRIEGNECFF